MIPQPDMNISLRARLSAWFSQPASFLLGVTLYATLFGMVQPHSGIYRGLLFGLAFPVALYVWMRGRGHLHLLARSGLLWAIGIILFSMLSTLWSSPTSAHAQSKIISHGLETILFIVTFALALTAETRHRIFFAKALLVFCVAGVVVSMLTYYASHDAQSRLRGLSLLYFPTKGPVTLLGVIMTAILILVHNRNSHALLWSLPALLAANAFIFMSQTRGALITALFFTLAWLARHIGVKKSLAGVIAVLGIGIVYIFSHRELLDSWQLHMSAGLSHRDVIWPEVLREFTVKPWLGHGSATLFEQSVAGINIRQQVGFQIDHPHGLIPSTLFYTGLAGLLLQLAYLLTLFRHCMAQTGTLRYMSLLTIACVFLATATNVHQLTGSASYIWWGYWLPTITLAVLCRPGSDPAVEKKDV